MSANQEGVWAPLGPRYHAHRIGDEFQWVEGERCADCPTGTGPEALKFVVTKVDKANSSITFTVREADE